MHARARKSRQRAVLMKSITVRVFASYVRVRARIIMKINTLVDRCTESLSLKFYEDPFIGCGEIAKTNLSMHINNIQVYFQPISTKWKLVQ